MYFSPYRFNVFDCLECEVLLKKRAQKLGELCLDTSINDFVSFDDCIDTCQPCVYVESVAWCEELRVESIQAAIHRDARDKDIDSDEDDDDEDMLMDVKSEKITTTNILTMLEKLQSFFESREEGQIRKSLSTLTESVERMKIRGSKKGSTFSLPSIYRCFQ